MALGDLTKEEIIRAFSRLSQNLLREALLRTGEQVVSNKSLPKQALDLVVQLSIEEFVDEVEDDSKVKLLNLFAFEGGLTENEKENSEKLQRLVQVILEKGIVRLVQEFDESHLEYFSVELGLEKSKPREDMEEALADEILLMGVKGFLSLLVVGILRKMCKEYEISSVGGKEQLVENLMVHMFDLQALKDAPTTTAAKKTKKEESDSDAKNDKTKKGGVPASPKKGAAKGGKSSDSGSSKEDEGTKVDKKGRRGSSKLSRSESEGEDDEEMDDDDDDDASVRDLSSIKKGITYVQMYDAFNASDLVEYCRNHDLKCSGKKSQIIKRILQFLDTGDTLVDRKGASKRKSSLNNPDSPSPSPSLASSGSKSPGKKLKTGD